VIGAICAYSRYTENESINPKEFMRSPMTLDKMCLFRYFYVLLKFRIVYNVIETVLAGYLVRKLAKRVVLLVLKPGTDIDITTLLFSLQSSNSPHSIAMN